MSATIGVSSVASDFPLHSRRGRWARALLARRGQVLLGLDPQGRTDLALIRDTRARTPLLLRDAPALTLLAWARAAAALDGAFAEAGVFMGGSARLICEAKGAARLHLFDVFDALQEAQPQLDADARTIANHFRSVHGPLAHVREQLADYEGVSFHPGVFPGSAQPVGDERFAFVHIDLDLYHGTRAALAFFWPRMMPGGIVIGDDYNLPEVRRAFDDHFADAAQPLTVLPWSQVIAIKSAR